MDRESNVTDYDPFSTIDDMTDYEKFCTTVDDMTNTVAGQNPMLNGDKFYPLTCLLSSSISSPSSTQESSRTSNSCSSAALQRVLFACVGKYRVLT